MTAHWTTSRTYAATHAEKMDALVDAATDETDRYRRPDSLAGIPIPTILALASVERVGDVAPLLQKGSSSELVSLGLLDRLLRLTAKGAVVADEARQWALEFEPLSEEIDAAAQRTDAFLSNVIAGNVELAEP